MGAHKRDVYGHGDGDVGGCVLVAEPMRLYDNETPGGRYVDTRDHRVYPAEQAKVSARGTRPPCNTCGWTLSYVRSMEETDWRQMNPASPTWDPETRASCARLAQAKASLLSLGISIYVCARCGLSPRGNLNRG